MDAQASETKAVETQEQPLNVENALGAATHTDLPRGALHLEVGNKVLGTHNIVADINRIEASDPRTGDQVTHVSEETPTRGVDAPTLEEKTHISETPPLQMKAYVSALSTLNPNKNAVFDQDILHTPCPPELSTSAPLWGVKEDAPTPPHHDSSAGTRLQHTPLESRSYQPESSTGQGQIKEGGAQPPGELSSRPTRIKQTIRAGPAASSLVSYNVYYRNSKSEIFKVSSLPETIFDGLKVEETESVLEIRKEVQAADKGDGLSDPFPPIISILSEKMIIYSPHLLKAIQQVVDYYPSHGYISSTDIMTRHRRLVLERPYRMLGGVRGKLKAMRERYENEAHDPSDEEAVANHVTAAHIKLLECELDKAQRVQIQEEEKRHRQNSPVASFDMLWLLFHPGRYVYTKIDGDMIGCRIRLPVWTTGRVGPNEAITSLTVNMWNLEFKGTHIDRRSHTVRIDRFEGERQITDLALYPVEFAEDPDLRIKLVNRGKRYLRFLKQAVPQMDYHGQVSIRQSSDKKMGEQSFYSGRVIIDPAFHFMEFGSSWNAQAWEDRMDVGIGHSSESRIKDFIDIDPGDEELNLTDDHFFLLPRYIRAFTLGTRKWVYIDIDLTKDYTPQENLIETIAMDPKKLAMIRAFTPPRLSDAERPRLSAFKVDPLIGKGEGRVIVLHGPPGVGKTYTAECMAETTNRPLLRLSSAELGLDPTKLETNLWRWFRMAERWDGLLLIDEADIYLQQREIGQSLERETIVAVFLRTLEYYRGILFLTSNRVFKFDDAITSRVSLTTHYIALNRTDKIKIRTNIMERLNNTERYEVDLGALQQLEQIDDDDTYSWSGREIGSVIQMAIALAEERAANQTDKKPGARIRILPEHVKDVVDNIRQFANYEDNVLGKGKEGRAQDRRDR